ncbi:MAG: T9SS type A sorting domain-containing protein [Ignavibacteriaceae bacterium]|nr:T9SS type A sorting domain-containing protein [Ignavibacteriaceae bacterium]
MKSIQIMKRFWGLLLLVSVVSSNIELAGQQNSRKVIELFKKSTITQQDVSPGYTKEILWYSTYFQGSLFVGTYPNAHIYKINPFSNPPIIEKDLGSVGYPGETNEPNEPGYYDMKIIQAILSDNHFIYGAVSLVPYLFYYNPATEKVHAFGNETLRANNIRGLYDPIFYTAPNGDKFIFFGAILNEKNNMKIIKWKISSWSAPENTIPEKGFQVITFDKPFPVVYDIELGKYDGEDVLYLGAGDGATESIFIYSINNPSSPLIEKKLSNINTSGRLQVSNFKADIKENIIWLFDYKIRRINLKDMNATHTFIPQDTTLFFSNNIQQDFPIYNRTMYLHMGTIELDAIKYIPYKNNTPLITRRKNLINNLIVGVHSWSNDPKIFFSLDLTSSYVNTKILPEPSQIKNPTGGGLISGLAVASRKLFSSIYFSESELTTDSVDSYWRVSNINGPNPIPGKTAVQSNKMIIDKTNNLVLYGLYKGPYLRIRSLSNQLDKVIDLSYLNPTLQQGRITSMALTEDDQVLLGTATVSYSTEPPAYILVDLKGINNPKVVAKADGGQFTTSLSYKAFPSKHRFYGTVDDKKVFLFDINKDNSNSSFQQLSIPSFPEFFPTSIVYSKKWDKIVLADCNNLRVYDALTVKSISDFYPLNPDVSVQVFNQFFHTYCGGPAFYESGYVNQLLEGNDGLIYGYFNGTIFHFDINASDIRSSLVKYTVPGYNENAVGLEISSIAIDGIDSLNNDVYIGTRSGKIFILTKSTQNGTLHEGEFHFIELSQNYPNPFNAQTEIQIKLPFDTYIDLSLYNFLGEKVSEIKSGFYRQGVYTIKLDFSNSDLKHLSSGVYYYQLKADNIIRTQKMVYLK